MMRLVYAGAGGGSYYFPIGDVNEAVEEVKREKERAEGQCLVSPGRFCGYERRGGLKAKKTDGKRRKTTKSDVKALGRARAGWREGDR